MIKLPRVVRAPLMDPSPLVRVDPADDPGLFAGSLRQFLLHRKESNAENLTCNDAQCGKEGATQTLIQHVFTETCLHPQSHF